MGVGRGLGPGRPRRVPGPQPRGEAAGDAGGFCAPAGAPWTGLSMLSGLYFTVEMQLPCLSATDTEFLFFMVCVLGEGCGSALVSVSILLPWSLESPHQPSDQAPGSGTKSFRRGDVGPGRCFQSRSSECSGRTWPSSWVCSSQGSVSGRLVWEPGNQV